MAKYMIGLAWICSVRVGYDRLAKYMIGLAMDVLGGSKI
ncbi:putative membrane protein YjdF [Sporosarcina psychrophila]|uniref:Membrane protein YjdF n=1 Tax=Sporosarcina psychrophila TaxID=1476 RepID=A0ABV2K914_SPOPS